MNRDALVSALGRALASIDLRARVRDALANHPRRKTRVLAIGKAAGPMAEGALDVLGGVLHEALVIAPDGAPVPQDPRVRVLRGGHPLPDERSVAAGEAALAFRADLALVSGGASSLAFAPVGSLAEARAALDALLRSPASVREVNVVRRHASRVHGGALGSVPTLIASDVIDGAPWDVGSGPTVADPTTRADAERVLALHAPDHALLALRETRKPDALAPDHAMLLVEPAHLARALVAQLAAAGCSARLLPASTRPVQELASEYSLLAATLAPGDAVVRSSEPTLQVTAPGAGGRCTHLAAMVALDLPPGVLFLAAASDGVDGASGTAGALVARDSFPDVRALHAALAGFATGPLHLLAGTALPVGPTGVNLADVHVLVRT
jgi:hydroxypyruvate reductase